MSTPLLLEVSGLSKSFGPLKAVNNASFVIRQGQVVGLIGSNGAGKTTLMRMLATLEMALLWTNPNWHVPASDGCRTISTPIKTPASGNIWIFSPGPAAWAGNVYWTPWTK